MPKNFMLTIEYDGTCYHGWQRQPNGPTIQEALEKALETMMRQKITLIGSGRTDAGVHALGQTANFACHTNMAPGQIHRGLNSLLPDDIVIRSCLEVTDQFHSRYDAIKKTYRYCILNDPLPSAVGRQYAWWIRSPLDMIAMQQAAQHLLGAHDFRAFEGAGSPRSHTIRRVLDAQWKHQPPNRMAFEVTADGFLRYMVRNIVGTLVMVGLRKITSEQFRVILESRDRARAAATAPARGLFLVGVSYE